ncbi:MFS transporter [Moraxella nasovis]|uniref:MFS transporter n=1 Tax=Moraxella nasovis TaxID=2904121 RepID=UPI001F615731|nr:MFS transporter [Moraxella nasovis]UNU73516.1 MFS transporter [Moraxella nasovis]
MASQFSLFKHRRFSAMFFTQFLGAFNDNVFKQALILVLTYTAAAKLNVAVSLLNNLAALLFILPYFLFSAIAGQVADKYEKSRLTQAIKLLEIIIMVLAAIGFVFEWYWLLFIALFLMGTHSAFFGPIKYAYLPQVMRKDELVGANGLFQTGTSLAILTGMMMAGMLTQLKNPTLWLIISTISIAILGFIASKYLPKTPPNAPDICIDYHLLRPTISLVKYLYGLPLLFFIILGNSWFWFYGATFLTQTPEFSKTILHGNESVVILLLTLFSVGTAIGSLLCKTLAKNQISLKLLPIGITGLSIFAIDLYFSLNALNAIQPQNAYSIYEILHMDGFLSVCRALFLLGFFGGIYIVPLYSFMQTYAPARHRSRIIGANNIFNAIFMVGSAIFSIIILAVLKLDLPQLFLITGIINAIFGLFLYKKLHQYQHTMTPKTNDVID